MDNNKVLRDLVYAGFGHSGMYTQTVWRYISSIMNIACKLNLAYPYDFGKGKGKYKTTDNISIDDIVKALQGNTEALEATEKFIRYRDKKLKSA